MTLDLGRIGSRSLPTSTSWTPEDVMNYALAVGAGTPDPTQDLDLTTENTIGQPLRPLPAFASLVASHTEPPLPGLDESTVVLHAEQTFKLIEAMPTSGVALVEWTVADVQDKGVGTLVTLDGIGTDAATDKILMTVKSSAMIVGVNMPTTHVSDRSDTRVWEVPKHAPTWQVSYQTTPDQALRYRLTGDRNPLHTDPTVAASAGFARPILHGMCTFGIACRLLSQVAFKGDACAIREVSGRFSAPMWPGDVLYLEVWSDNEADIRFRARRTDGTIVIDRGNARL